MDDLHIGITNSNGNVFEFDKCGLVINDNIKWKNCAAIEMIPDSWQMFWDEILTEMCNDSKWKPSNYNDATFNCFNFVISFLQKLNYKNTQFMNKEEMCEAFVLPRIQTILKYASIYKNLKDRDVYVQQ